MQAKLHDRFGPFVNGVPKPEDKAAVNGRSTRNGTTSIPPAGPEPEPPTPTPTTPDRDTGGRFQSGCRPGPGNPFAKRVAALRQAVLHSVTEADVVRVGTFLLDRTLSGDVAAAKVLLGYVVGKPTAPVEPARVELEAWKLLLSWPTVAEVLAAAWAVRPAAAAQVVEAGAPTTGDEVLVKAADRTPLEGATRIIRRREEKGRWCCRATRSGQRETGKRSVRNTE